MLLIHSIIISKKTKKKEVFNMALIKGTWGNTKVICGNHPVEEQEEMVIQQGAYSLFYACKHYNNGQYTKDTIPCLNRINLIEYEKMLEHLSNEIIEADERNEVPNLTNHTWKQKNTTFTVVEHNQKGIVVRMLNEAALKGLKI
jgi:hypothetical protein